jgi:hypothetical protein
MNFNKPHLINFSKIGSSQLGYISVAEKENLPFVPKRIYWTYFTPEDVVRGHHAHFELEQILVAVAGNINLEIEMLNGECFSFILDKPQIGVYIPKMTWRTLRYSHNAVLMCIASIEYNENDYIRNYDEFKQ